MVVHERTQDRKSWEVHGKDGFYVGPKLKHYRCFEILVSETGATRTSDTIAWFPKQCIMPGGSPSEILTEAVKDLTSSIQNMVNTSPSMANNKSAVNILAGTLSKALTSYREMFHAPEHMRAQGQDGTQPDSDDNEHGHHESDVHTTPLQRVNPATEHENQRVNREINTEPPE